MREESKALLRLLLKISVISLFCIIAYLHPKFTYIDPAFWMLAYVFSFSSVLDIRDYMKIIREKNPVSIFHGHLHKMTIWGVFLWAAGIYILGLIHISDRKFDPIILSGHIGLLILPLMGFGWLWLMKKFKNPVNFLARYLSTITMVSLFLFLAIPTNVSGRQVTLFELVVLYPSNYLVVHLYSLIAMTLIGLYSLKLGRSLRGARFSGVLVLVNIILFIYIFGWKLGELDVLGWSLAIISIIFQITAVIPQSYWALYFGKLPMTVGVGWE